MRRSRPGKGENGHEKERGNENLKLAFDQIAFF